MKPEQIAIWEANARGKIELLRVLAEVVSSGEIASSGWLRVKCGLSADEWHDSGELIASLIFFASEKGFLKWHAESML